MAVKLSRNTQIIILIAAGLLSLHLYNMFLYQPLRKETRFMAQEKIRIENELATISADKDELQKAEEVYKAQMKEYADFEAKILDLERRLPSRKNMSEPLDKLTATLEDLGGEFIALEPTFKKAGEAEFFDSIEIKMQFYADFELLIDYLSQLESESIIFSPQKIEMVLDEETSKTPLVTIYFSTFISDRPIVTDETGKEEKPKGEAPLATPFRIDSKPYDNRLPGEHKLTMVVWKGGKKTALIDGKLMAEGELLENKTLEKIESDGVWFEENGIRYRLGLENKS